MTNDQILFYSTLMALLALVAVVTSIALLVVRLVKGPHVADLFGNKAIWAAWLVALVATLGSVVYSEVIHFLPCRLCWFQRIAMYPMSVILLVGAIRRETAVKFYALPLSVTGLAISVYHYIVQTFPSVEGGSCDPTNPCSAKYVDVFDFISIPFMAGCGFILISVLLTFYVKHENSQEEVEAVG